MSESLSKFIDITAWVDSEVDPVLHRRRRATHILLAAIAKIRPPYTLYLKGGILLGLMHNSTRMTTDIDLTANFPPSDDIDIKIKKALNQILPEVAAILGYTGTETTVHSIKKIPKPNIEELRFPSLSIKVEHVSKGKQRDYIPIQISFNEPDIVSVDIFDIGDNIEVYAYSLVDVVAEKYRAILQQSTRRKKGRRQDIYDIDFLLDRFAFDNNDKNIVLEAILEKCRARDIDPSINSIDEPEIEKKARKLWDSMKLETGFLPEFDSCFKKVRQFYRDLPWDNITQGPKMNVNLTPSRHKLDRLSQAANLAPDKAIDAAIELLEKSTSKYQVSLSFAGEQRSYVEQVAKHLKKLGVAVFYDGFETVNLWGKGGAEIFHEVFASKSAFVVMFISKPYANKEWTIHERRSALSRMIKEKREYILPVCFDDTKIPGLTDDKIYLTAEDHTAAELAILIAEKIGIKLNQHKASDIPAPQMDSCTGEVVFNYSNYNGRHMIGRGKWEFETKWSKASNTSIYILNDPPSIRGVAIAREVSNFSQVVDDKDLDFTSRVRTVSVGQIVVLQNSNGFYAVLQILEIKDDTRGDDCDELRFQYAIQTNGSCNFA